MTTVDCLTPGTADKLTDDGVMNPDGTVQGGGPYVGNATTGEGAFKRWRSGLAW
jgi:hypothetical protein